MPRRALRNKLPSCDFASTLFLPQDLPRPWCTEVVYGFSGELIVEVGCGKGMFLQTAGRWRPDACFLGIELARSYAELVAARVARDGLTNVRVVNADARKVLADVLPPASVAEVHVYFPDPWWKRRHRRRRLMAPDFVQNVERVLIPNGRLEFWSDVQEYFESTLATIEKSTDLHGPFAVSEEVTLHDMDFRTHFERRVRLNHLPVYRAYYRRPWQTETILSSY
jgi:tRNA (guanine-N7-)-methyltransferase